MHLNAFNGRGDYGEGLAKSLVISGLLKGLLERDIDPNGYAKIDLGVRDDLTRPLGRNGSGTVYGGEELRKGILLPQGGGNGGLDALRAL